MSDSPPSGRAWVFGDRIDTDVLAPGHLMKLPAEALAAHCLEAVRPGFAANVRPGDFVVAGSAFGIGSSREQAAVSLRVLGVRAVLAHSFAGIFRRNAINLGLPVLTLSDNAAIADGDRLSLDLERGILRNLTLDGTIEVEHLPSHLLDILSQGGLLPWLERQGAQLTPG